jgi:nucleotide-binding universal stress UspA family protein
LGRYTDFTRSFLPKKDSDRDRWAQVMAATKGLKGLPPVELYRVGEAYFVRDGHHRVSVAQEMGIDTIEAYVSEVETRIPLSPQDEPRDVILKAEYGDFLERSRFDEMLPEGDFMLTVPRKYADLQGQVRSHRENLSRERGGEVSYDQAVQDWYERVYLPVVEAIERGGVMREFPGRTKTDLYLWIFEHRGELEAEVERGIRPEAAAQDLVEKESPRAKRVLDRMRRGIRSFITPDVLEPGPEPGRWRQERGVSAREGVLFPEILVAFSGEERSWLALDQAINLGETEGARLYGLHVYAEDRPPTAEEREDFVARFQQRCEAAGLEGSLHIMSGPVTSSICARARWNDLIVLKISYPPPSGTLGRMASGIRNVIRRCPRPVLAVPGEPSDLERPLLAFDGSPKAREALFAATYLAGVRESKLTVLHVYEGRRRGDDALESARSYIDAHGGMADYVEAEGSAGPTVVRVAEDRGCDLILMGGYGHSPAVELVLGSAVDEVLRESGVPVLVCR